MSFQGKKKKNLKSGPALFFLLIEKQIGRIFFATHIKISLLCHCMNSNKADVRTYMLIILLLGKVFIFILFYFLKL